MIDVVSPERRSAIMAKIRSRNTAPELSVRRYLHSRGLRFRIHGRSLPGKPDLVFPSRKACVFVHGCFWHGCTKCVDGTRAVKSNVKFWREKILKNRARDASHKIALQREGWKVFTIWECETQSPALLKRLAARLKGLPRRPIVHGRIGRGRRK